MNTTPPPPPPAFDLSGLLEMTLSLMLVIGLIVGLAWVVGRLRTVGRAQTSGTLNVLGELVIGPKERVVLIRVGDAQALLGIGANGVTSLQLLDRTVQVTEVVSGLPNAANFAQKLKDMMNRQRDGQ